MKKGFDTIYPYLNLYCEIHGYINMGQDEYFASWVRVLDMGGMRLEVNEVSLTASLEVAELWAKVWMEEQYAMEVGRMLGA
jgi:hypothetical protein